LPEITVRSSKREEAIDITEQINQILQRISLVQGLCHIYVPHTTAGIMVNEGADPSVVDDILSTLAKMAPRSASYRHLEGNADAHIKAAIVGSSVTLPVTGSKVLLGTWQSIFFMEFDGPRTRRLIVTPIRT
jgi:secondary thiamine-phosphate synthase enzyme